MLGNKGNVMGKNGKVKGEFWYERRREDHVTPEAGGALKPRTPADKYTPFTYCLSTFFIIISRRVF